MKTVSSAVGEKPIIKRPFWRSRKGAYVFVSALMILLPAVGLFFLVKIPQWADDAKLAALVDRFESYPLPPKTERLDYSEPDASIALRGNGNHCDYRARWTFRTQLTGPELAEYYEHARIEGVEKRAPSITVWLAEPSKRSAYPGESVAIVELYDGTSAGLDLRCT
ncbi:hypothetical protein AB0O28_16290 [Microbispora sp. NPDC088329]|uniref:hypothetical protein n=1 Tax=Microbispora sp. NPDC088329 TaxID=3154869 RepID=UPI00344A9100